MTRGAKIGENRFKRYVELCTSNRVDRLLSIVMNIQREKLIFDSLTSMSHYVAKRFNESNCDEYGNITNTTLLRNPKYRVILLQLYENNSKSISVNVTSAQILEMQIYNEKLKSDLAVAKLEVNKLKAMLSEEKTHRVYSNASNNSAAIDACYKIILIILEKSNGVYVISDEGIVDKSNLYNNIIVPKELLNISNIINYQHYILHGM